MIYSKKITANKYHKTTEHKLNLFLIKGGLKIKKNSPLEIDGYLSLNFGLIYVGIGVIKNKCKYHLGIDVRTC